jgi:predicted solute-binding protein
MISTAILLIIVVVVSTLTVLHYTGADMAQKQIIRDLTDDLKATTERSARAEHLNSQLEKALEIMQAQFQEFMQKDVKAYLTEAQIHAITGQIIEAMSHMSVPVTKVN